MFLKLYFFLGIYKNLEGIIVSKGYIILFLKDFIYL